MYARSYGDSEIGTLPPHYDGVAFNDTSLSTPEKKEIAAEPASAIPATPGVLSKFLGADFLHGFGLSKIGTEELLLLVAAAFLFFSRDGDKECAILILILVFLA